MPDRLTDEQLDHIIETHRGTLVKVAKNKQVYAPVENLEQTIRGLEEAKERRAETRWDGNVGGAVVLEYLKDSGVWEPLTADV